MKTETPTAEPPEEEEDKPSPLAFLSWGGLAHFDPKLARWVAIALGVGWPLTAVLAGFLGVSYAILVLAGGMLIVVIATFWASIRTLAGETPLAGADAYALGAPRAEEEKKRAVLRALKDLEFERNVGKISEEDYRVLVAKYRAEAKQLLRLLDEEAAPRRKQAEALVAARLRKAGLVEPDDAPPKRKTKKKKAAAAERPSAIAEPAAADAPAEPAAVEPAVADPTACKKCGTNNDADAVFCKKCGARRGEETETEDAAT